MKNHLLKFTFEGGGLNYAEFSHKNCYKLKEVCGFLSLVFQDAGGTLRAAQVPDRHKSRNIMVYVLMQTLDRLFNVIAVKVFGFRHTWHVMGLYLEEGYDGNVQFQLRIHGDE